MLARTPLGPHVAFVLQGLEAGGSEHIVSQLCNHFASQGWTVTLLAFENPTTHPYYSHDPAVRIVPLGMKSERRGLIGGLRAMRARCRLLRKSLEVMRPDIVVSFLTRTNVMACIAARCIRAIRFSPWSSRKRSSTARRVFWVLSASAFVNAGDL